MYYIMFTLSRLLGRAIARQGTRYRMVECSRNFCGVRWTSRGCHCQQMSVVPVKPLILVSVVVLNVRDHIAICVATVLPPSPANPDAEAYFFRP
jgi:hypothetical protein